MTYFPTISVKRYLDSESNDAFGRIRFSTPLTLFDSKQTVNDQLVYYFATASLNGGTVSWSQSRASSILAVTTASGSLAVRQTRRRMTYQPGKSLLFVKTFIFGTGSAGVVKRTGYFDERNGIFVEQSGSNINLVLRSNVDDVFSETRISQSNWNLDRYDGSGSLTTAFNPAMAQVLSIDYQWLGVGRVRVGFHDVSGSLVYVHQFLHANQVTKVYMRTPSLPARSEVRNIGGTTSNSMENICTTVMSEAGWDNIGVLHSVDNGQTAITIPNGSIRPLVSIRMAGSGSTIIPDHFNVFCTTATTNYRFIYMLNPILSGSDSAVWQSISGSSVQYDVSRTNLITGGPVFDSGYAGNGNAASGFNSQNINVHTYSPLGSDVDRTGDIVTLAVQPIGTSAAFLGSIAWRESE